MYLYMYLAVRLHKNLLENFDFDFSVCVCTSAISDTLGSAGDGSGSCHLCSALRSPPGLSTCLPGWQCQACITGVSLSIQIDQTMQPKQMSDGICPAFVLRSEAF